MKSSDAVSKSESECGEARIEVLAGDEIDSEHRHVIVRVANFAKRQRRYRLEFYSDGKALPCLPSASVNYTPLAKKGNAAAYQRQLDFISSGIGGLLPTLAGTYDEIHVGLTFRLPERDTVHARLWHRDRLVAEHALEVDPPL